MKKPLVIAATLFMLNGLLSAMDITVVNGDNTGVGSLRAAIDTLNLYDGPHNIWFSGVEVVTLTAALPAPGKSITIDGGAAKVTINASAMAIGTNCLAYGQVTLNLKNLIFDNALISIGSASGTPAVGSGACIARNCVFKNGRAGAVKVSGTFTAINSQFYNNQMNASTNGVAIRGLSSANQIHLDSCIVRDNNSTGANGGAAIYAIGNNPASTLEIRNSVIYNNLNASTGTNYGGGIASAANTTISNSAVYFNTAKRGGGLALLVGGTTKKSKLTITNSTISGNTATETGGGICVLGTTSDATDSISISNSTISQNGSTGDTEGGGIMLAQGANSAWILKMSLNNCTVTGNTSAISTGAGGGIGRSTSGTLKLWINYSIVAGNNPGKTNAGRDISSSAGWLTSLTGRNVYGGTPSWGTSERTGNIALNDATTGAELVSLNQIIDDKLADHGGTVGLPDGTYVKTHALPENSHALNPVKSDVGFQTIDQRGFKRDEMPDIGAFEYIPTTGIKPIRKFNEVLKVTNDAVLCLESGIMEIVSVSGVVIQKAHVSAGQKLDVPAGIHILRFSGEQGISMLKTIR
jgi:hypothetical protein